MRCRCYITGAARAKMQTFWKAFGLGINTLIGRKSYRRDYSFYPDDLFLVSYPKSGNTWCRFMLAQIMHPDLKIDFTNIDRLVRLTFIVLLQLGRS